MRRRIAVVGDTLNGGGQILPYIQRIGQRVHGHMVALIGGKAYCETCKGTGVIAKAGGPHRLFHISVREVALDGDIVQCDCATPRVIVGGLAGRTWHEDQAERYAAALTRTEDVAEALASNGLKYCDEQFALLDGNGRALPDTYYTIRYSCGSLIHGITDDAGCTMRHRSMGARPLAVYLGHVEV